MVLTSIGIRAACKRPLAGAVAEGMAPVADVDTPELVMDLKFVRAKWLASNGNEYPRPMLGSGLKEIERSGKSKGCCGCCRLLQVRREAFEPIWIF